MPDDEKRRRETYEKDTRIACQYGIKCYQRNPEHHKKYKHPSPKESKKKKAKRTIFDKKRKRKADDQVSNEPSKRKTVKTDDEITDADLDNAVTSVENNIHDNEESCGIVEEANSSNHTEDNRKCNNLVTISSLLKDDEINVETDNVLPTDSQAIISCLFLTRMPKDFFQFYEFCENVSKGNPFDALKDLHLEMVGPYDVFKKGFLNAKVESKQALLNHWRYYYDPPEFQTVIKDNGKDGLHFGYWRDDMSEKPVFVAKNKATVNCIIEPVAENIFGALDAHIGEKVKLASVFEKTRISQLHQKLKSFAKEKTITLEKNTSDMQARERKVVARTFHKAGIVVPYDKKTELGYRDLAVTDSELQKLLKQIEHPPTPEARKTPISKLEEVIRLATIAADECDFGTVLELSHDLFSSGVTHIQTKTLNLFSLAYNLLQRPEFLKIAEAHLENRRKGLNLSVLRFELHSSGTVLELSHDLFSSGVTPIQTKTLNLFSLAYNLLQRPEFLKIAEAHLENRRKGLNLSVLRFE